MEIKPTNTPLTLHKDLNTIFLSWDNLLEDYESSDLEFILFLKTKEHWNFVYRGPKSQYTVKNLEPSTCYTFKLKIFIGDDEVDNVKFKAATDFEPYYTFHISRALTHGKTSLLRKVVNQRPILLELENKDNKTPLSITAETGDLPMTNLLISLGVNINNPLTLNKRTPLMIALFHGHLQIANLLLDKGADITRRDCNGLTGIHHAVDSGKLENVEFAVEHGFDVNAADNSGWTALLRAVVMDCDDEIIKYLLGKSDERVKDKNGFDFRKHCEISGRKIIQDDLDK